MTSTSNFDSATVVDATANGENMELVRGQEQDFLARLEPVVECQSIVLDLESVERIDAAGVSALITLYCSARRAGYSFTVAHPRRHVREVLSLVGLDRVLLAGEGVPDPARIPQNGLQPLIRRPSQATFPGGSAS